MTTVVVRSQSAIKERICSLNLNDDDSNAKETCKFTSFGHGIALHDSIRNMSRSTYEAERKRVIPLITKPEPEIKDIPYEPVNLRQSEDEKTWIRSQENGAEVFINASTRQRV